MIKPLTNKSPTTFRAEWRGVLCGFLWFFCSMYSFDERLASQWIVFSFIFLVALAMVILGLVFGASPETLSSIARFTVPVGAVCTGVMALLPAGAYTALYLLSAFCMAPLLLRRIYGVVETAGESRRFRGYMSAVAVTILLHTAWILLPMDYPVKYPLLSIAALLGLAETSRSLPPIVPVKPERQNFPGNRRRFFWAAVALALLLMTNFTFSVIHTHIAWKPADENLLLTLLGRMLPPVGFFLYALFADRKKERIGFTLGLSLALIGLILVFLPGDSLFLLPLIVTDGIGGTFTEYFILTMSLYFIARSSHPVLTAAGGFVVFLLVSALDWVGEMWYPPFLVYGSITIEIVVLAALLSVLLLAVVFYLLDGQEEQALVLAIWGRNRKDADGKQTAPIHTVPSLARSEQALDALPSEAFSTAERDMAALLCQGYTHGEIAKRLSVPAATVKATLQNVAGKIEAERSGELGALLQAAVATYMLTDRESQMLRGLAEGKTSSELAAELFISESTVKFHVRNLLKKLSIESRYQIPNWLKEMKK